MIKLVLNVTVILIITLTQAQEKHNWLTKDKMPIDPTTKTITRSSSLYTNVGEFQQIVSKLDTIIKPIVSYPYDKPIIVILPTKNNSDWKTSTPIIIIIK